MRIRVVHDVVMYVYYFEARNQADLPESETG
jgi:hypothetical protein